MCLVIFTPPIGEFIVSLPNLFAYRRLYEQIPVYRIVTDVVKEAPYGCVINKILQPNVTAHFVRSFFATQDVFR